MLWFVKWRLCHAAVHAPHKAREQKARLPQTTSSMQSRMEMPLVGRRRRDARRENMPEVACNNRSCQEHGPAAGRRKGKWGGKGGVLAGAAGVQELECSCVEEEVGGRQVAGRRGRGQSSSSSSCLMLWGGGSAVQRRA